MTVEVRDYHRDTDLQAAYRIWREVGWYDELTPEQQSLFDEFLATGRTSVAVVDGAVECLVASQVGDLQHLDATVSFAGVTGVTTSRVARKQGLAGQLVARVVAANAAAGIQTMGLWCFEQGYYDRFGFGTGNYNHWLSFDPAQLDVDVQHRMPKRLDASDWAEIHASRLGRLRDHGSASLTAPINTHLQLSTIKKTFGLGYFDGPQGELTHHFWTSEGDKETGPYRVWWMAYETYEQLLELLALLRSLGDQVRLVELPEPAEIQLQDFIKQPFRFHKLTKQSPYTHRVRSAANWQVRIIDLPGCLRQTHLPGAETVRFNLTLSDPITRFLETDAPWRGSAGDYVVTLGPASRAEPGNDDRLPTLRASVNAFTRLWLGVRSATGLSVSDELNAPPRLLQRLDRRLRLPTARLDWNF